MKKILSTEGLILDKNLTGENHNSYILLSPVYGKLLSLQRTARKSHQPQNPDLFDIGEFDIEVPNTGIATFIREFTLRHRFSALSKSYQVLKAAAQFAQIINNNLQHAERFAAIYQLCCTTFNALAQYSQPTATLIKSLYIFARDEGYPVKEDWYANLAPTMQREAALIINTPLAELQLMSAQTENLFQQLQAWLHSHTDIVV